jgi:hypothetical protein
LNAHISHDIVRLLPSAGVMQSAECQDAGLEAIKAVGSGVMLLGYRDKSSA